MGARDIVVQLVRAGERADWEPLWRAYQAFYNVALSAETTDIAWQRLHDPAEPMHVLGAYLDRKLTGIAHYIFHRSTWSVGGYCYLQDLFVADTARGLGLGRALIEAVYEKAREAGVSRVYWLTHEGNAQARLLYDGVAEYAGFIQYRKNL